MSEILRQDSSPRKSRPRGAGIRLYREVTGAESDEAAHAKARRVITEFFLHVNCLRIAGNRQSLMTLFARFTEELAQDAPRASRELLLIKGRADRAEDQAREEALHCGMTPDARRLLIHRVKAEVCEALELLRALEAEEMAHA